MLCVCVCDVFKDVRKATEIIGTQLQYVKLQFWSL